MEHRHEASHCRQPERAQAKPMMTGSVYVMAAAGHERSNWADQRRIAVFVPVPSASSLRRDSSSRVELGGKQFQWLWVLTLAPGSPVLPSLARGNRLPRLVRRGADSFFRLADRWDREPSPTGRGHDCCVVFPDGHAIDAFLGLDDAATTEFPRIGELGKTAVEQDGGCLERCATRHELFFGDHHHRATDEIGNDSLEGRDSGATTDEKHALSFGPWTLLEGVDPFEQVADHALERGSGDLGRGRVRPESAEHSGRLGPVRRSFPFEVRNESEPSGAR